MELKITEPFWQVVSLGTLAGMRTSSAPVITSHILSHHKTRHLAQSPLRFMQSNNIANTLKMMALSELIADKLPFTPNRIKPLGVAARVLSGALAGASIYKATGHKATLGAVVGGVAAFASTFGSFYVRKSSVKLSRVVDPIIGAIEDALVIGSGVSLVKTA